MAPTAQKTKAVSMSDEEIIKGLQSHMDAELFGVLYDRYVQKVYHKCISMTRDKELAADLSHDIFLKVFVNMSKFSHRSSFSTWLYSITYNYCLDHLRKASKQRTEDVDDRVDIAADDEDRYEKELLKMKAERLQVVLGKIDPDDRAMLLMKYQEELSVKQIMEMMGLSESAVKMRMLRARSRALSLYEELYSERS